MDRAAAAIPADPLAPAPSEQRAPATSPQSPASLHPCTPASLPCPSAASPLSPRHLALLASLFALDFDTKAWTAQNSLSTSELIAFSASPHVRAAINAVRSFTDLAESMRHRARRRDAIERLHHILLTATDPEVQRKAAAALLRATAPLTPARAPAAGRVSNPPPVGLPTTADMGGAGVHPAATSPTPWVEPYTLPDPATERASAADSACSEATSVLPSLPDPAPSLPAGSLDPSFPRSLNPSRSPESLIDHLARAFHPRAETTEPAFRVLHASLSPDATLNGEKPARDFPDLAHEWWTHRRAATKAAGRSPRWPGRRTRRSSRTRPRRW